MAEHSQESSEPRERWRRAAELPPEVLAALRKENLRINPVTVVATVDEDGWPHAAPFGSTRAVTPRTLRMLCLHYHDTYANVCRDGRVTVTVLSPPDIAVTIRGRARVVRERMKVHEHSAVLEVEVEEVKNDMPRTGLIGSAITFFPKDEFEAWFEGVLGELEAMPAELEG
jgi:hypothetical protein